MIDTPQSVHGTKFDDYYSGNSGTDCDELAHFAGRACYQSWHMPNPGTSDAKGYISNIISQGHFSVLEHASATFYVEGVSRNLTHELVRHRHLSYSELSQRFVDMNAANFVVPPAVRVHYTDDDPNKPVDGLMQVNEEEIDLYNIVVAQLTNLGYTRKQAREAARFYLPSGMETKIVVTGNMRAWRDMLHKRYSMHADAEIREFSGLVLQELQKIAPASFQDFPDEPFQ
jgi:thymidylate synthase (FAD)